jgi:hypothetical protein
VNARSVRNDWTSSTSTQGNLYSASSTTSSHIHSLVFQFSFPPVYAPVWLTALIRRLHGVRGRND